MESVNNEVFGTFLEGRYPFTLLKSGDLVLPDGFSVESFKVANCSFGYRERILHNQREFLNFKTAFQDAVRKLKSKAGRYSYKIELSYLTDTNSWNCRTVCYLSKKEDKIVLSGFGLSDEEAPSSWMPKSRSHSNELEGLINELQTRFNIKEIVFRSSVSKQKQKEFLSKTKIYFETMNGLIDFSAFEPSRFATSTMKKWGGTYKDGIINLIIGKEDALYHEFFHHIDLSTSYLRKHEFDTNKKEWLEMTKAGQLYMKWCEKLFQTKTMQHFYHWNKYLLNEYGAVKTSKFNTKEGKYYIYWTSYDEMTARFFEDYMFYYFFEQLTEETRYYDKKITKNYSIEEVESLSPLMLDFLKEIQLLVRKSNIENAFEK